MNYGDYFWDYDHVARSGNSIAERLKYFSNIHLLTEMPGNIGDHLIWEGTTTFLHNHKISFKEVKWRDLETHSRIDGCLLIPGSGALTKHFNEWLPETIEDASGCFTQVIVLPSQLNPDVESVRNILGLTNVLFFSREENSYSNAKEICPVILGIDLALFSQYFGEVDSNESSLYHETLISLRTDAASEITNGGYCINNLVNNDISITKSNLVEWMQSIKDSKSIVTDRLHIAVFAVMLNKNLFYVDPDVSKISDYFKYAFGSTTPTEKVVKVDLKWLCQKGYIQLQEVN